MNFLFVCGGTAGHINPALAIAEEARRIEPRAKILFVGAGKELEKKLIPRAGFHLVNIKMSGFRRGLTLKNLAFDINVARALATASVKAEELVTRFKPDAVIGTGGYICYPVIRRAAKLCIPTFIHESNAVPGLTTKLLSASVDKVFVSFPGLEKLYRRPENVVLTGTPVRGGFEHVPAGKEARGGKPVVVSFWGSLGAERMNEMMTEFIMDNLSTKAFDHIHAAGRSDSADALKSRLKKLGAPDELPPGIEIREYIDDMQSVMERADIVMCRAGGSTIAELTILGKPAVLIPSPYVTNNQQIENATQVEKAGGAVMLREKDCTGQILYDTILSMLNDPNKLKRMSEASKHLGSPDCAANIICIIMERCGFQAIQNTGKESGYGQEDADSEK